MYTHQFHCRNCKLRSILNVPVNISDLCQSFSKLNQATNRLNSFSLRSLVEVNQAIISLVDSKSKILISRYFVMTSYHCQQQFKLCDLFQTGPCQLYCKKQTCQLSTTRSARPCTRRPGSGSTSPTSSSVQGIGKGGRTLARQAVVILTWIPMTRKSLQNSVSAGASFQKIVLTFLLLILFIIVSFSTSRKVHLDICRPL